MYESSGTKCPLHTLWTCVFYVFMIANHEHAINSCMLCLPSLAGIWTRIAHSKQFSRRQKKSDALDRSAAMTGLYVCLFVCLCFLSSYFYLSSISPSLCISSFKLCLCFPTLSLSLFLHYLSLSLSLFLFIYLFLYPFICSTIFSLPRYVKCWICSNLLRQTCWEK